MNRFAPFLYLLIPLGLALGYVGCAETPEQRPDPFAPVAAEGSDPRADAVRAAFLATTDTLSARLDTLWQAVEASNGSPAAAARVQGAFAEARAAYKRIEYMAEYQYPQAAERINGPALPEVEPDDQMRRVRPPEGFQVIEEALFPASHFEALDAEARGRLLSEIAVLRASVERVRQYAKQNAFADRHVWEAMQQEMIRLVSLGLSGFDSPVAQRSLPEAAAALRGMKTALGPYAEDLERKAPGLLDTLRRQMDAAAEALTAPEADFDAFDRLGFLTAHANPISRMLYDAHDALGIEEPPVGTALRATAKTVYDEDAFRPAFFAPARAAEATPAQRELGRMLFYEPALSGSGERSCATCHHPDKAFTDGRARSLPLEASAAEADPHAPLRNAPTLLNASLQGSAAHDLSTKFLEDRITAALTGELEMNGSYEAAAARLGRSPAYVRRVEAAFGPVESNAAFAEHVRTALAAYMRSLNGLSSRFDRYVRGERAALTAAEKRGFNLFMGKALCGTCHFAPLFNGTVPPRFADAEAEVLGVPAAPDTAQATVDPDVGKFALYAIEKDRFAFKTPTVRNAALTAPYMHNGVYQTLAEVVDFYNRGGGAGIGIHLPNQTLPPDPLNLSAQEQADLVAFMEALTDTTGLVTPPAALPALAPDDGVRPVRLGAEE